MNPIYLSLAICALLRASTCIAQESPAKVPSPDGKFIFEFVEPDESSTFGKWKIVAEDDSKTVWESPDEANVTWARDAQCVWSPDSKRFALNYRAGSRYEVAEVYQPEGKKFRALPSFEKLLAARLDAVKNKQLRELVDKFPPSFPYRDAVFRGSFKRRLWDRYRVDRWIDGKTVEVTAYSTRQVTTPGGEVDGEEIFGSLRFVLRLEERGGWKILGETEVPIQETD